MFLACEGYRNSNIGKSITCSDTLSERCLSRKLHTRVVYCEDYFCALITVNVESVVSATIIQEKGFTRKYFFSTKVL